MKLLQFVLLCSLIASCSSKNKALPTDEQIESGSFSPAQGAPLIYFRDGNFIVIKSCNNSSKVDLNNAKAAREKCEGKENKVSVEIFKQMLKKIIAQKAEEKTAKEASRKSSGGGGGASSGQAPATPVKSNEEKLQDALTEKELQFIETYNKDNSGLQDLKSTNVKGIFNQKLKTQFDKTLDVVVNDAAFTTKNAGQDRDEFISALLKSFDPNKMVPCGLEGTVEQRVESCAKTPSSSLNGWRLITRTNDNKEIWQSTESKLIWGNTLSGEFDHIEAGGECSRLRPENGTFDSSLFRLPTIENFESSYFFSGQNPLKDKEHIFWTSTSVDREAWVYNGSNGTKKLTARSITTKNHNAMVKNHARCVLDPKLLD